MSLTCQWTSAVTTSSVPCPAGSDFGPIGMIVVHYWIALPPSRRRRPSVPARAHAEDHRRRRAGRVEPGRCRARSPSDRSVLARTAQDMAEQAGVQGRGGGGHYDRFVLRVRWRRGNECSSAQSKNRRRNAKLSQTSAIRHTFLGLHCGAAPDSGTGYAAGALRASARSLQLISTATECSRVPRPQVCAGTSLRQTRSGGGADGGVYRFDPQNRSIFSRLVVSWRVASGRAALEAA